VTGLAPWWTAGFSRRPGEPIPLVVAGVGTIQIEAARRGDREALACLFRELQPGLLRYLRHLAPEDAEDLAQEAWIGTARALAGFRGDGRDFRALLFAIARRRLADHHRRAGRRPRTCALEAATTLAGPQDTASCALGVVSAQQAVDALGRHLPRLQAEVVLLRVVADLSVAEVAQVLGRSPGSVRVLQHRALRRLAELWEGQPVTP
jgi:RNA polymerase sigma factor (sigma-70 family)